MTQPLSIGLGRRRPTRSLRVLFATNLRHLPQAVAGSQRTTDEFCFGLIAEGWTCAVLSALEPSGILGIRTRGVGRIFGWSHAPPDRVPGYPVYRRWRPTASATEVIRQFRPDVAVVMAGTPATMVNALLANHIPTLCYLLDVLPDTLNWRIPEHDHLAFLACSRFVADRARTVLGVEAPVLLQSIRAGNCRTMTTRESVVFVNPIRLKGVEIALAIAAQRPDIPFDFFESWDHPEYPEHRARARELPNVTWHDATLDPRRVYARARVLLAPSQWDEAWGRVVSEAHINGIPVIASRRGGLPEAVGPGGIIADAGDTNGWLNALSQLWDHRGAYLRSSAAALAYSQRAELRPETVLAQLTDSLSRHARFQGAPRGTRAVDGDVSAAP